jgi:hypothetical protein
MGYIRRWIDFDDEIWISLELNCDVVYLEDFIIALLKCQNNCLVDQIIDKLINRCLDLKKLIGCVISYGSLNLLQKVIRDEMKIKYNIHEFVGKACRRDDDNPEILDCILEKLNVNINNYCHYVLLNIFEKDNVNITKFVFSRLNRNIVISMLPEYMCLCVQYGSHQCWRMFLENRLIFEIKPKKIVKELDKLQYYFPKGNKYIEFAKVTMEAYNSRLILGIDDIIKNWPAEITESD